MGRLKKLTENNISTRLRRSLILNNTLSVSVRLNETVVLRELSYFNTP